jgi:hypothetical protein
MKERVPEVAFVVTHYFLKNLIPMWRKQKTDTADGLFLGSEIAHQLVAQFINNMLVKTSPWPQVCL